MAIPIGDGRVVSLLQGDLCFGDPYGNDLYKVPKNLLPALVCALKGLGLFGKPKHPEEPLAWYTVERHGQPPLVGWFIAWTWAGGTRTVIRRSGGPWHSDTRYLPLDHLHGHSELPGWDEVAPAPEPELPAPWLAPHAGGAPGEALAYAWALNNGVTTLEQTQPFGQRPDVIAWCLIKPGGCVPPHPYVGKGKDENP